MILRRRITKRLFPLPSDAECPRALRLHVISTLLTVVSKPKRRIFAAMVKLLDESVGIVSKALSDFGLAENRDI